MKKSTALFLGCCFLMLLSIQQSLGQTLTGSGHQRPPHNNTLNTDQYLVPTCFEFDDQENIGSSQNYFGFHGNQIVAQSFVAGAKGRLVSISVDLQINSCPLTSTFKFKADILEGAGYNGTILASQEVVLPVPYPRTMLVIDFAFPATVNNGQSYTIRLSSAAAQICTLDAGIPSLVDAAWFVDTLNPYSSGKAYINGVSYDSYDAYFITTINPNSALNMEVTACRTYFWSATGLIYFLSGVHQALYENSIGCDSIVTLYLTINNTNASAALIDPYSLQAATAGATYQWLNCEDSYAPIGGATAQTFFPGINGIYAVEVTMNACPDTSDCIVVTAYGIKENSFGDALQVYPNPSKGTFTVDVGEAIGPIRVAVFNALGQTISDRELTTQGIFNVETGPANGIYLINLYAADGRMAGIRVIKE